MSLNASSKLSEDEKIKLMKMINNKRIWRDSTTLSPETISNGLCIQPFKTLSSFHLWVKRNLLYISETDEYVYISGCNVIIQNAKTNQQKIIQLKNKCCVTSIYYQKSSTNERILFVGEKLEPDDERKIVTARVEIINLDNKDNGVKKKLALDLGVYVDYNSYIYDIVSPKEDNSCVIILKNLNINIQECKIFVWNYLTNIILGIENFKYNIQGLSINHFLDDKLLECLIYSDNYCGIWTFENNTMQFKEKKNFYDSSIEQISNAAYIHNEKVDGVVIAFQIEWIEVFLKENDNNSNDKYNLFLRFDLFSQFINKNNNITITDLADPETHQPAFLENFIEPSDSEMETIINNITNNKIELSGNKNFVKFIICRGNYILLFFSKKEIVMILELIEENNEPKIKLLSTEVLPSQIGENCSVLINPSLTMMILINDETKYDELLLKLKLEASLADGDKEKENILSLKQAEIRYYKFKINPINKSPVFEFTEEILKNSALGYPVHSLAVSEIPRIIIAHLGGETNNDKQQIFVYKQKTFSNLTDYFKQKNFEASTQSYIQLRKDYYAENTKIENFYQKELEEKPLSICFSPQGKSFFISYKDCGYLYIIIEKEVKELFKISMYCRSCTFDETGCFLAFSTSEFDNDYNINILNLSTYEYEYMITKLPQPNKIIFGDGARCLLAQFNDNSTNLLGWKLDWEHRLIENNAFNQKEKSEHLEKNAQVILKISDFSGNIIDFAYDQAMDMCLITSHDKRVRVYCDKEDSKDNKDEGHWEFATDVAYSKCLIIKKYDSVIFGTEVGSLRVCLWPIQNMLKDSTIDHPEYIETCLHTAKITSLICSKNYEFLYTSSIDGSIFISCISAIANDAPLDIKKFYYFDSNNVLPKKIYFTQEDMMYITDSIYQTKVDGLKKKKSAIQSMISEFQSKKEKVNQNNTNTLEKRRDELTEILDKKKEEVKKKESEKEKETKYLKDDRDLQLKKLQDELKEMKEKFHNEKKDKQLETTKLINCIKYAKEKFEEKKEEIKNMRTKTNKNIATNLENMNTTLIQKKEEIDKLIKERTKLFEKECEEKEEHYENDIRSKESELKKEIETFEEQKKVTDNNIMKKNKDNKNYDEKITEWDNHLKELKINNEELMETYIFNTLKLNQMNQLLSDNENKISSKEKIVKEKRLVNDRLEQLRFVLEYQIKNLILEKTPIEEQIKNFESLHSDFYKRFNLLYTELLNISDLIESNQKCITTYRDELSATKKNLYRLKNLYKSIDVALNSILKNKLDTKKDIIDKIFEVYQTYLYNFNDNKKQTKYISPEMKLQTKNIEKEIYNQKNNVLKELIDKRSERRKIIIEKEEMMKDIRLDNQLLIQECSNIRENLEDILKNINDIEKKFIELTNNNTFLSDKENLQQVKNIKESLKEAKKKVAIKEEDKIKVGKNNKLPPIKPKSNISDISNGSNLDKLRRKQEENTREFLKQNEEIEEMQKHVKGVIGSPASKSSSRGDDGI